MNDIEYLIKRAFVQIIITFYTKNLINLPS